MTDIRMETEGLEELTDLLKHVAPRSANNVMRNAVMDLARDVRDEMKQRVPSDTGTLKKAIKAKRRRAKHDELRADVEITQGKGQRYDGFYWHFVEFGTKGYTAGDTRETSSGRHRVNRNVPPRPAQPFINPSAEAIRPQVPRLMREHFGKRYEKEMQRLAKRKGKK